ncbi:autotransporter domain-containing protein [Castellaniella hirudinis]|uniref:Autotransporter domain-containing protein n=1 Tax=Castellaniella hirudinis TaxID=1144617 RepID=A0ABV8RU48_9BURK
MRGGAGGNGGAGAGGGTNTQAGAGGDGGNGGQSLVFTGVSGPSLTSESGALIQSGVGGAGGSGGAGATGLSGAPGSNTNGSSGGSGGNGGNGGDGSAGISATAVTITNRGEITGGDGGSGGSGGAGGNGGNGGDAGGGGGNGGNGGDGGFGGWGGAGISATDTTIINSGTISGGAGGNSGAGGSGANGGNGSPTGLTAPDGPSGIQGQGGVGIRGNDLAIVNSGAISGGQTGGSGARANAIEFTGGNNSLELQAGWSIEGNVGGTGTNTLILGGHTTDATTSFDASRIGGSQQFRDFALFQKTGAGTWTLTGSGTQDWTIDDGSLVVNGTAGNIMLNGGTLSGIGTVGHVNAAPGSTIAPGNSIGTLNVASVTFDAGSIYQVEVNAAGQSDRIEAGGTATIHGGTVQVLAGSGNYAARTDYIILSAANPLIGTFDGVTSNLAFLTPSLRYDTHRITLSMARNAVRFPTVGRTPNQRATGAGVESLGAGNTVYDAVTSLSADQARTAFDQLSGEIHASAGSALTAGSQAIGNALGQRLQSVLGSVGAGHSGNTTAAAPRLLAYGYGATAADSGGLATLGSPQASADSGRFSAWGSTFGTWGRTDSDGNAAGLHRSSSGFLAGVDGLVAPKLRLGVLVGYSHDRFDTDGSDASGSSDNYHLGLYGGSQHGALSLKAGAIYTWHQVSTRRSAAFPGYTDRLTADYDARTFQAFGEVSYRIDASAASFEPFANLAYLRQHTDGFTEQGGAAALHSASGNSDTTYTTLGLRAAMPFDLGRATGTARGLIGWRHAAGDTTPRTTLAFSGGEAFSVAGVPIDRDAAVLEAGLDFTVGKRTTLGIAYTGQFGARSHDNGARAHLNIRF